MRLARALLLALSFVVVDSAFGSNLVDARWLASKLESPDLLVLDASPRSLHNKAHIPGAVPVNVMVVASFGVRDVSVQEIERIYESLGIDPGKKIVIYDQGGSWFGPRLFFQLRYHGFPLQNLAILDGGMAKWQAEGLPVSQEATPAPKGGGFKVAKFEEQERTRPPELLAAAGDRKGSVLVDALGPEYHYGAAAFFNKAGHIPNALLMPAEDLFNADKTFKSPVEIRRMAAHLGIRPEQEVHSHCGGGGAAAVPYFALKYLAGYPRVKLSIESQMGWLQDERDLPFWTYASPALMRDTDWLKSWGGRMMRMYGVANVSVLDVRPPAAYSQGHVPFAVNVPGEVFRGHAKDARKLAELLGASGVDPAHEAVIVTGGGVTKDAALAYVMLEKLGQKKVSLFMESLESPDTLDKMARAGFAVTKDATIVGKAAKPTDLTVTHAHYAAGARAGVTIGDGNAAGASHPKVFIASGPAVPTRAVEGKVVHVPYTELLKADGTPKAAKDIWAVLAKAGVPRYAELVAYSDDPGEAAANYYILKLMGFPDIKVLMS
ncbi:MAG TPA: rhodanese-like domain-containing protein [Usitatibacter sp.]|nr:rhodanese-like domain-containing protein [Usitatibacter sp.]